MSVPGYNPFDPIQDTESYYSGYKGANYRGYNPFDPIQDTESTLDQDNKALFHKLQPIRSDSGY